MALIQNLPPQAYTRDTLVKAIEWLSSQPPAIRERASSADLIVSYYLAARRKAAATMETSVSPENFKSDLKHLAADVKRLEEPEPPPITPNGTSARKSALSPPREPLNAPPPVRYPSPVRTPENRALQTLEWTVDQRSLDLAREVQERLNLGHESEALRLMIQLGAERVRTMFP